MNSVGKMLMKRKKPMAIFDMALAAGVSYSHAKNSVTSEREIGQWLPSDKVIICIKKRGAENKYKVASTTW